MKIRAKLIIKDRVEFQDGAFAEVRLWGVPKSKDKHHGYKYSLVYIEKGKRILGYDNAEGKGDHRHYGGREEVYSFKDIDSLREDFFNDIKKIRGGER